MSQRHRSLLATAAAAVFAVGFAVGLVVASPANAESAVARPEGSRVSNAVSSGLDDFTFDSFDADYTLTRADDGTSRLRVVETLVAVFPEIDQNHGIRRAIPDTFKDQPVRANLVSITDENGQPRPAEVEDVDGEFSVVSRADEYLHGAQTFVITYTLENVVWKFPDTGLEFFWDVNGVAWDQPFARVTARLHLPADVAANVTGAMACYQGYQGARDACDGISQSADADGGVVVTASSAALQARQTLTMAVGFVPDSFTLFDSSYLASPFGWVQGVAGVAGLGALVLAVRSRRGPLADEAGRPTIIAEYTPPASVDALESAVLLGKQSTAIPAEVLEQAVVGSIRIVEGPKKRWGKAPLIAELIDPSRADGDGRMLLDGLFPDGAVGDQYEFGTQDTRFSSVAQKILKAADEELTTRGMRRSVPSGARLWPVLVSVIAVVLAFGFGVAAIDRGVNAVVPFGVIVVSAVVCVAVMVLVFRRPLTARGAETRDHLLGLKEFIEWAEADRIRMLQSPEGAERAQITATDSRQKLALYEKLLPYAVVFGQEREWSKQLAVLYTAAGAAGPYWYVGSGSFDASSFSAGIGSLSSSASSSSSTGGSSGGGSAGGGGGGGGGGGV